MKTFNHTNQNVTAVFNLNNGETAFEIINPKIQYNVHDVVGTKEAMYKIVEVVYVADKPIVLYRIINHE